MDKLRFLGIFLIAASVIIILNAQASAGPPRKNICPAPTTFAGKLAAVEAACRHFGMVPDHYADHDAFGPKGQVIRCLHFTCRKPNQSGPVARKLNASNHPPIPSGLKVTCLQGPSTNQLSDRCPVIKWGRYIYWAYSHRDNRSAMTIVAYDTAGNIVKQWYETGARYVWRITVNESTEKVTLWGQDNKKIVVTWDLLRLPGS